MRNGADVVLVGMGGDDGHQCFTAIGDEHRVGHLHTIAAHGPRGRVSQWHFLEGHAAIHHEPLPGVAVQIEVHADLAAAPQWEEPEILETWNHVEKAMAGAGGDDQMVTVLSHKLSQLMSFPCQIDEFKAKTTENPGEMGLARPARPV